MKNDIITIADQRDGENCGHGLELLHKISWDLVQRLEAAE